MKRLLAKRHLTTIVYALLVVGLALPAGAAVGAPLGENPITVTTRVSLEDLPQGGLALVGLGSTPGAEPSLVSVSWGMGQSSWLPVWQLVVTSDAGLIPTASGELKITQVTPTEGHTYEATLSYDPRSGILSLGLLDATTDEYLVRQGWSVSEYVGPLFAAELGAVTLVSVSRWYEPVDTRWDVGTVWEDGFVPLQSLERAGTNQVRLRVQGPLVGEFKLTVDDGEGEALLATTHVDEGQTYLEFSTEELPIGHQTLTLQYEENGEIHWTSLRQVQVGRVSAGFASMKYNRDEKVFDGEVVLKSESPLFDVDIDINATLTQMVWDSEQRVYVDVPYLGWASTTAGLDVSPEGVNLPLQISAPELKGIWRIDFKLSSNPAVGVELTESSAYVSNHAPARVEEGESYVIAVLPDTQYYTKFYSHIYMRQAEWLSANAAKENIAFTLHVGDSTEDNFSDQWRVARNAHSLMDGVVPYVLSVGNHDYAQHGLVEDRSTTLINRYFSIDDFPNLTGTMVEGKLENTYHTFHVAGIDYLIVSLEFAPADEMLDWANEVVAAHPDHTVIVLTHAYLHPSRQRLASGASADVFPMGQNPATTMNDGEDIWAKFIRLHKNILLVLSGHIHSDAIPHRISIRPDGNEVHEILANYQAGDNGGNGFLVLLEFTPDQKIIARALSPYLDEEKTGLDRYGNASRVVIDLSAR